MEDGQELLELNFPALYFSIFPICIPLKLKFKTSLIRILWEIIFKTIIIYFLVFVYTFYSTKHHLNQLVGSPPGCDIWLFIEQIFLEIDLPLHPDHVVPHSSLPKVSTKSCGWQGRGSVRRPEATFVFLFQDPLG